MTTFKYIDTNLKVKVERNMLGFKWELWCDDTRHMQYSSRLIARGRTTTILGARKSAARAAEQYKNSLRFE